MLLRRVASILGGLLGLAAISCGPALAVDIPAGGIIGQLPGWPKISAQTTRVEVLRPGVTLSSVDLLLYPKLLHVYQIDADLGSGVSVSTVLAQNSVVSTGETVTSMANRTGALAGVQSSEPSGPKPLPYIE